MVQAGSNAGDVAGWRAVMQAVVTAVVVWQAGHGGNGGG